jgi:DNA topoisomerase VI subunit A
MSNLKSDLLSAVKSATKVWKAEMRKADKNDRLPSYGRFYSDRVCVNEIVYEHMEEAYNKASSNGKYWANARQIFYAIRPSVLAEATKDEFDSKYFMVLLKNYLEEREPNWRVVWDARGHFTEPHTGKTIGCGGIDVMEYMKGWRSGIEIESIDVLDQVVGTKGPANRYGAVLFIEKEGFDQILEEAKIAERYDMAIISTKGNPVKAACDLLNKLQDTVHIFILHDFDKSGFIIRKTLSEGCRMAEGCEFIDLGLRLEDVKNLGLESEEVSDRSSAWKAKSKLAECGATEEEISFLIEGKGTYSGWSGKRVELNAMTTEEFLEFIEKKLKKHGVKKVIPNEEDLGIAYRRAILGQKVERFIYRKSQALEECEVPSNLESQVKKYLKKNPEWPWDKAIWRIVSENEDDGGDDDNGEDVEETDEKEKPVNGISKKLASDAKKLAVNKGVIDKVVKDCFKKGEIPTAEKVLKAIEKDEGGAGILTDHLGRKLLFRGKAQNEGDGEEMKAIKKAEKDYFGNVEPPVDALDDSYVPDKQIKEKAKALLSDDLLKGLPDDVRRQFEKQAEADYKKEFRKISGVVDDKDFEEFWAKTQDTAKKTKKGKP